MTSQPPLEGLADYRLSERNRMLQSLADFRREWQSLVEGKSLLEVNASVGLLLADIADRLDLNPQERHAMLGGKLINQVNSFMEQRIEVKLTA
jgi:hypothetical protein